MPKRIFVLLLLAICIGQHPAIAQNLQNSLLWKITGNGLKQPSYLYGTIHLTDERVFRLGDSLYSAIEKSEGFAIEVSPEEMMSLIIDEVKDMTSAKRIKELLNKKDFDKYSKALSKKFDKPAEKITTQDVLKEKNKWITESYKNGKMTTFLDAYLFDVARRQGKWTGGIEDLSDQKFLIDRLFDVSDLDWLAGETGKDSKSPVETLVQLYINDDINGIDQLYGQQDSAYKDMLLIKRNIKMARRMDSLSSIRSTVFAVGAAHLPGQDGVIKLLQQKGFAVQPVFSSHKIAAASYKMKEVVVPWVDVEDKNGLYKAKMPGKPGEISMYGVMKMNMYFDIFSSTGYFASAMATPYGAGGIDSVSGVMGQYLFQDGIKKGKKITVSGISGYEYEYENSEGFRKGYVLIKNNVLYLAYGHSVKKNASVSSDIDKFLQSFAVFEPSGVSTLSYQLIDSVMAYSVILPSKPEEMNELATGLNQSESERAILKISIDPATGVYFFVGANEVKPGFYIKNDSLHAITLRNNIRKRFSRITLDTIYTRNNNPVLEMAGLMEQQSVLMKAHYELRGGRWHGIIAMYNEKSPLASIDRFFKSFTLLDYQNIEWKEYSSNDKRIKAWSPSAFTFHSSEELNDSTTRRYIAFDSTRSNSYDIIENDLGKYYWQKNDSTLWATIAGNVISNDDTLLHTSSVQNGNLSGVEFVFLGKNSKIFQKERVLLAGGKLITLYATQQAQNIRDENVNRFFEDFRLYDKIDTGYAFRSKATLLLNDILSPDSITYTPAIAAMRGSPFDSTHLPLLHKTLLKCTEQEEDYFDETPAGAVLSQLLQIKHNSTLQFAYDNLPAAHKNVKPHLLNIISSYASGENYQRMTNMLLSLKPSFNPAYHFQQNLLDNDSLTAGIIKDLLPLVADSNYTQTIISVVHSLVKDSLLNINAIAPYANDLLKRAETRLRINKIEKDYEYTDMHLIYLLGRIALPATNAMLKKWLLVPAKYPAILSLENLLKNKQTVTAAQVQRFAIDKAFRLDLYDLLKEQNKLALFPKQYLTQRYFAESRVFNLASDDYEPLSVVFIKSETIILDGKKTVFYFFKVNYENEGDDYYLVAAGPFSTNPVKLEGEEGLDAGLWEETFDATQYAGQKKKLVEKIKTPASNNDE